MLIRKLWLVTSLLLVGGFGTEEVVKYTDDNFRDINNNDITLMFFYSPECHYCESFLPLFEEARLVLLKHDPPFHLIKIDCIDSGVVTCEKEGITGYPALKIYRKGTYLQDYTGNRTLNDVVEYMKENYGYKSSEILRVADMESFLNSDKVMLLGFFQFYSGLQNAFLRASVILGYKLQFGHVASSDLLKRYSLQNDIILCYPKHLENTFESANVTYKGSGDLDELLDFIKNNYHGLVGHRQSYAVDDFNPPLIVAYYKIDYVKSKKLTNYWRNRILQVAKDFVGKITFAISCKYEFEDELLSLGLNTSCHAPVVVATNTNSSNFLMGDTFSVAALRKFAEDFVREGLEAHKNKSKVVSCDTDDVGK